MDNKNNMHDLKYIFHLQAIYTKAGCDFQISGNSKTALWLPGCLVTNTQ